MIKAMRLMEAIIIMLAQMVVAQPRFTQVQPLEENHLNYLLQRVMEPSLQQSLF